jgi:hypothetical protein
VALIAAALTALVMFGGGSVAAAATSGRTSTDLVAQSRSVQAPAKLSRMGTIGVPISVKRHGVTWRLGVLINWSSTGSSIEATLTHVPPHGIQVERHDWDVNNLPARSVTFHGAASWTMTLPAKSISPLFRSFNLTFRGTKHHKVSGCTSGAQTDYTGTLKGGMVLATGFVPIGKVGSRTISFGHKSTGTMDYSCLTKQPCASTYLGWYEGGGASPDSLANGVTSKGHDGINVQVTHDLARPADTSRTDEFFASEPAATFHGKSLSVPTKHGSGIRGSATLTRTKSLGPPFHLTCWRHGTRHTQVTSIWAASFASTPLRAKTRLTGTLTTPGSASSANVTRTVVH